MSYKEKLQQIDFLRDSIEQQGQIPMVLLNKINYKLRLEWNYTSNSMEGNSLTRRETRTVMVGVIDVNDKPIKDVIEIRNHDQVISTIMKIGQGELNVSESRIKDIHKGIMYEEDPDKIKHLGQWKSTDNYMIDFDGERYDFVPFNEVPQHMHELVNWLNTVKEKIERKKKDAIHPVLLAIKFHLDYLTIHPFYDGNGRTARILSNLILISYGFPPIYIKENEKGKYYQYLTDIQSNGGRPDLLYEFMAGLLIRSMQMIVDTLDDKEIEEEEDDIDKEIDLFKRSLDKSSEREGIKNWENVARIIEDCSIPLFKQFRIKLSQFNELFHGNENRIIFSTNKTASYNLQQRRGGYMLSTKMFPDAVLTWLRGPKVINGELTSFGMEYLFKGYKFSEPYDLPVFIRFSFDEYIYKISFIAGTDLFENYCLENNYDQIVSNDSIDKIVKKVIKTVLKTLKED